MDKCVFKRGVWNLSKEKSLADVEPSRRFASVAKTHLKEYLILPIQATFILSMAKTLS